MRIAVLTGAGMSAESGVPTFRDALTGLWARHDPQALATADAFRSDPALVWGWYRWRAAMVRRAQPHAGHLALARLAHGGHEVTLVTQNVDDLHERAGSTGVVHVHGSLFASRCLDCGTTRDPDPILALPEVGGEGRHEPPPRCDACGGPFRPGVVWFGEALPEAAWATAMLAVEACDWLLVVGTSGLVHPAASLPRHARAAGARVTEVNPVESAVSAFAHEHIRLPAGSALSTLLSQLR